jgi:peptide deformylase
MSVRNVIQAGHLSLKTKNKIIKDFDLLEVKKLIKDLKDTMYETQLVGIAAPQIAKNLSIFITHPRNTKSRKLPREDILRVFINPKITNFSSTKSTIYEGCGSIAEGTLFGPVERAKEIKIIAQDENGNKFSLICDGLLARVIQHEYDHSMGIEFIQKVNDYSKILSKDIYKKTIRDSKEQKENSKITKIEYKKY